MKKLNCIIIKAKNVIGYLIKSKLSSDKAKASIEIKGDDGLKVKNLANKIIHDRLKSAEGSVRGGKNPTPTHFLQILIFLTEN